MHATAPATPIDADEHAGAVPRALPLAADGAGGVSGVAFGAPVLAGRAGATAALRALRRLRQGPSPSPPAGSPEPPAVGYTTVTGSGEEERERLKEEARLIASACRQHRLVLGRLVRDLEIEHGSALRRPGLAHALDRLAAGDYAALVVSRLDRLTRSPAELAQVMRTLGERSVRLIVIDIGLDTGTPDGRLAAEALVTVGGLEDQKADEDAPDPRKPARKGRRSPGRPAVADRPSLKRRIVEMRASGMTLQAIADTLNAEGVPTVRGGAEWRPSSVQAAAGYRRPPRRRDRDKPA